MSAFRDGWQILRTIVQAAAEDSVPAHSHLGAVAIIGLGLGALIALGAIALPQGATNVAGMDAISAAGPAPPAAAALLPITINPVDDAYVAGELPNDNFGSDPSLDADASPVRESYVKFDLRALAFQGVSQATLRMYVTNGSGGSFDLRDVADSAWTEGAITFNNKPAKGDVLASFTPGTATGRWLEVDITSATAGKAGSFMSAALQTSSTDALGLNSSEAASNRLELVIQLLGATPGPSATVTSTPAPTSTGTATPTPSTTSTSAITVLPGTTTLNPIDDAYVAGDLPGDNFGSDPSLVVDASPVRESYLKFDLRPFTGLSISTLAVWGQVDITSAVAGKAGSLMSGVLDTASSGWICLQLFRGGNEPRGARRSDGRQPDAGANPHTDANSVHVRDSNANSIRHDNADADRDANTHSNADTHPYPNGSAGRNAVLVWRSGRPRSEQ